MKDTGNYLCMTTTPVNIHPGFSRGVANPNGNAEIRMRMKNIGPGGYVRIFHV